MNQGALLPMTGAHVADPGTYTVSVVCSDSTNGSTISAAQVAVVATAT